MEIAHTSSALSDQSQGLHYHNTNCQVLYLSFGICYKVVAKYVYLSDNKKFQFLGL